MLTHSEGSRQFDLLAIAAGYSVLFAVSCTVLGLAVERIFHHL